MKEAKKNSTLATTITSFLFTLKGQASPRKLWQDLGNKRRVRSRVTEEMDRVLNSVSFNRMPLWKESTKLHPQKRWSFFDKSQIAAFFISIVQNGA